MLYDGLRGDPYAGFSVPQLFNIERVEVLKGPAGALYGGGDAGGVINYVTRKPKATPERRIELQAGNNGFRAASVEATGPMNAAGSVRYRAGLYGDTEQGVRWNADSESAVSYTHLRAHETREDLVCRLRRPADPVSYTHLTLPTNREV